MPDIWMDVDTALSEVPVNIFPLIDDTDFKSREVAIAYDAAGMDLVWNFVTTAGAFTQTAVTPTTAGNYDWTHQGDGMYTIEIPASGGASINNDTEGFGWFTGICTGVLPWRGPVIGFRAAGLNNKMIDDAYSATRGLAGTALPDAAAEAAGGLYTRGTGAGQVNQPANGLIDVNVENWNTTAVPAEHTAGYPIVTIKDGIGTGEINTNAGAIAVVDLVSSLGSSSITAGVIAADAIGASELAADALAEIAAQVRTELTTELARIDVAVSTRLIGSTTGSGFTAIPWNAAWDAEVQSEVDDGIVARNLHSLISASGTADSGSTTTMVDAARTEGDADYWKGQLIVFTSGTLAGQSAIITDFNAVTDTFTFAPALTQAVATHNYVILPNVSVWDDTLAEHLASGTTGNALNAAGSAGDPWATALPGAYGAGTAGRLVGRSLPDVVAGAAGGLFIAGSNAATTVDTLTVSGTTTLTGAVSLGSTLTVTGATTFAAIGCTTLTASGAVAFQSTFIVTGATTFTGAVTASNASNNIQARLQNAVAHGGTSATLTLGSSSSSAAFLVQNFSTGAAAQFTTSGSGDALGLSSSGGNALSSNRTYLGDGSQNYLSFYLTEFDDIQTRLPAALTAGGNMKSDALAWAGAATATDDAALVTSTTLAQASVCTEARLAELDAANIPADVDQIKADLPGRVTKNTALTNFEFLMVDETDGYTAETGLTITATRSIDGAAFAACTNSATEVSGGIYKIDLAAGDLNGNVITLKFTATGARTRYITIVTQPT